jgi:hypothetical protein
MKIIDHIGNQELLKLHITAFLCSRSIPASIVLRCYDWAIHQRESGICVISGFHSQIERDVFHYLEKGNQPIIIAMARGIPASLPITLKKSVESGRILIITPFDKNVTRVTNETASIRNKMMIELADKVVIGFADPNGKLNHILSEINKEIKYL